MSEFAYDEDELRPLFTEQIGEFANLGSADLVSGVLEGEGFRAKVKPRGLAGGIPTRYLVFVDPRQLHRAKWILRESDLTEAELAYLATGRLGEDLE